MIDWASLAERAKEQHMKNYRFTVCERDNNNKTPKGKQLQYHAYMPVLIALQICTLCVCVCPSLSLSQDLFIKFTVRNN